jgi:hypothetical protein
MCKKATTTKFRPTDRAKQDSYFALTRFSNRVDDVSARDRLLPPMIENAS